MTKFCHILGSRKQELSDAFINHHIFDLRLFGVDREVAEFVDFLLDLIDCDQGIGSLLKFKTDCRNTLGRCGRDVPQVVDGLQYLFQRDGDADFDIFRAGPVPGSPYLDDVQGEIGEELDVQLFEGNQPTEDHQDH